MAPEATRDRYPVGVLMTVIFWGAAGLLAWVYIAYPTLVFVLARVAPWRVRATDPVPTVSVAIAVHNEATAISARIADVFAQEGRGVLLVEVLVGSDGSTDETDRIVEGLAASEPRLRLLALGRAGQTPTQDALFREAIGDVVVLTDAETRFEPGCLAALAEAFRDPRVGAATGRLEWRDTDLTATSANEGLYWRYERIVRAWESRAGLLTAVTGALLAVRRSNYRPVPATASMDHLLPLYVREAGGSVVYVADAVATDRPISGLREQFQNRKPVDGRPARTGPSSGCRPGDLVPQDPSLGHATARAGRVRVRPLRGIPWIVRRLGRRRRDPRRRGRRRGWSPHRVDRSPAAASARVRPRLCDRQSGVRSCVV